MTKHRVVTRRPWWIVGLLVVCLVLASVSLLGAAAPPHDPSAPTARPAGSSNTATVWVMYDPATRTTSVSATKPMPTQGITPSPNIDACALQIDNWESNPGQSNSNLKGWGVVDQCNVPVSTDGSMSGDRCAPVLWGCNWITEVASIDPPACSPDVFQSIPAGGFAYVPINGVCEWAYRYNRGQLYRLHLYETITWPDGGTSRADMPGKQLNWPN